MEKKKICSRCKIEKEITEFCRDKTKKDGFRCECKTCRPKQKNRKRILTEEQKEKDRIRKRKEYKENPQKRNEYKRNWQSNKKKTDKFYYLKYRIGDKIRKSLKKNHYIKNSKIEDILGCTYEEFRIYLESKFEFWMSWNNKGLYNGTPNFGWDIDHIIPLSSAITEEEVLKLNHYTNLQPLCSYINRDIKRDKTDI